MYVRVHYDLSIQKSRYDEILKRMEGIEGELRLLYTCGIANALSSPLVSTNQQPRTNQLIATNWQTAVNHQMATSQQTPTSQLIATGQQTPTSLLIATSQQTANNQLIATRQQTPTSQLIAISQQTPTNQQTATDQPLNPSVLATGNVVSMLTCFRIVRTYAIVYNYKR